MGWQKDAEHLDGHTQSAAEVTGLPKHLWVLVWREPLPPAPPAVTSHVFERYDEMMEHIIGYRLENELEAVIYSGENISGKDVIRENACFLGDEIEDWVTEYKRDGVADKKHNKSLRHD